MDPKALQDYLHQHIPISAAMGVEVTKVAGDGVDLRAPLAPNINHRDTVFGGSASALAILSAWSLVNVRLREVGIASRIVIQKNSTEHDLPIDGPFSARSRIREPDAWERFLRTLERRGRGRVTVHAELVFEGAVAGRFKGDFVALIPGRSEK
jgi:thioesterase domain-containing protein